MRVIQIDNHLNQSKKMKKIWALLLLMVLSSSVLFARLTEIPFVQFPTGQIIVQINLIEDREPSFFIYEPVGKNLLRGHINAQLYQVGVDTTKSKASFSGIMMGEMKFSLPVEFRIAPKLEKRSDLVFAPNTIGTIGPGFFKGKSIQFNFNTKRLRLADSFEELEIGEDAFITGFTSSFTNDVPVLKVSTLEFGEQQLYIDPSKPVAFNFSWQAVDADVSRRNEGKLPGVSISLNGKDQILLMQAAKMETYINHDLKVNGFQPTLGNDLIPCIGSEFLKHYLVTFDFEHALLYLVPVDETGKSALSLMGGK